MISHAESRSAKVQALIQAMSREGEQLRCRAEIVNTQYHTHGQRVSTSVCIRGV